MNEHLKTQPGYYLPVIMGPTAAGKTRISLSIAGQFAMEIISADSMQVYRDMDIGTAKVDPEARKKIKHHLIDIISPEEEFSVAQFQKKCDRIVRNIYQRDKIPLLVGGTGLYIKAVLEGFMLPEIDKDEELRAKLRRQAKEKGKHYVHEKLAQIDPPLAEKLHPNDLRRVIRGLEIYYQTGHTKTYYRKCQQKKPARYRSTKIGLTRNREELYRRINNRVERMIEKGLIAEVKELKEKYSNLSKTARQALGYSEILAYLNDEYNLEEAVRLIKRNTRHFAKRQLSWFRREDDINWFNLSERDKEEVIDRSGKLIVKNIT